MENTTAMTIVNGAATSVAIATKIPKVYSDSVLGNYFANNTTLPTTAQHQLSVQQAILSRSIPVRESDMIRAWNSLPPTPLRSNPICFSSWTRFTGNETPTKTSAEMKMSELTKGRGVSPSFNPPLSERTYLGVDQPVVVEAAAEPVPIRNNRSSRNLNRNLRRAQIQKQVRGRTQHRSQKHQRTTSTLVSCWSTDDEDEGETEAENQASKTPAIEFKKESIKRTSTSSLLTISLQSTPGTSLEQDAMVKPKTNLLGMHITADDLPSAFDSDDDSDEEE